MSDAFDVLQEQISELQEQLERQPKFKRGQITSVSPLRVKLDGGTVLNGTPDSYVPISQLKEGDYVDLRLQGTRVIIQSVAHSSQLSAVITPLDSFTHQPGFTPIVTLEAGRIWLRGGWAAAGMSVGGLHNAGQLPAWAWPDRTYYFHAVSNNAANTSGARCIVYPDGRVQIRPGTSLGTYYLHDGVSWGRY